MLISPIPVPLSVRVGLQHATHPPIPHRCLLLQICSATQGNALAPAGASATAIATSPDPLPIVFLTGAAEIQDSVRAMKSGAVDFLTKSADGNQLLDAVERALARDSEDRARRERRRSLQERYERLTAREREVFPHLISGRLNKQICADLGAAEATIKIHRHRVLAKMGADSIADLVRMAVDLEIETAATTGS